MATRQARSAARIATLTALPIALLAGVVAFWLMGGFPASAPPARPQATGPVQVDAPPLDEHTATVCRALLARMPESLDHRTRRPVTAGPGQNAAYGDPPVVLSCGVAKPAFPPDAQLLKLSGVCWWPQERADDSVWTTVDRQVPVRVVVPKKVAGEIVVDFSPGILATVPPTQSAPSLC